MHTYISLLCQLRRLRSNNTPVTMSTSTSQSWFLIPLSNKRNQKRLILGLEQNIHKMNLEHLVVPETRKCFKNKTNPQCQRNTGANWKSSQWPNWNNLSNTLNRVVLDYNQMYKYP